MLGRIKIKTDVSVITYDNCIDVLRKAISKHMLNAERINFLLEFEEGAQPLIREKKYRTDIDCQIVDNIANEIVEFKVGFQYGNPITFKKRNTVEGKIEAVQEFNNQYLMTDSDSANQELARFMEIGGICNTYIDINEDDYEEGDSYYKRYVLDPRSSFVIYSSIDGREMAGVTFRKDSDGVRHYTMFTKDYQFEIKNWQVQNGDETKDMWEHDVRSGEINPLHIIPITEFYRSYDRMGCFERQIDEMNNLNLLISDFSNDVDQNTQVIFWTNDCEFETVQVTHEDGTVTEEVKHPKSNEWLQTYTTRDGKTPKVQPLTVNYDYAGILNNIVTQRALILQKCNVPQRNDNSGGSTGVAMSDATGWSAAETAACKEEMVISKSLRKEIKVICAAIRESTKCPVDSPLRDILPSDLEPSIKRQKSYELSVKTTAIATLLGQGFSLEDTLDAVQLFPDPAQVIERSKEGVEKKQNLSEEETEVTAQSDDPIHQIGNSPTIDGNSNETVEVQTTEVKEQ
jgi:SPP1 family phage portal protein